MELAQGFALSAPDEKRYRLLVDAITDYAIYMIDLNGIIITWNPGAERFKGYATSEIIGRHFCCFYTEEDRAGGGPEKSLATAIRDGHFEEEGWRVRKDGTRFWAHVVINPIRDSQGEIIAFAKIARDITDRRDAQQALLEAREALLQSRKMEAVGRLTGGIAHDFNNLLMIVLGNLELLRKRLPNDPKLLSFLDNAIRGAERGASLTKRMLVFARRQELKVEAVALAELMSGVTALAARSLGSGITIETDFPNELPAVLADFRQLEGALLSLFADARDAMPFGGTITVSGRLMLLGEGNREGLLHGHYVCLTVADSGQGMDEETLQRAVEPFFSTKGVGMGTGLGLSIVHGMMEQLGGRMSLRSCPGAGTAVSLWLPLARGKNGGVIPMPSKKGSLPPREAAVRPLVILAVDDDALVLMNTSAMLEELGHRILEATSGSRALEILEKEDRVDLIITDQAMPQMTGLELIEAIRSKRPDMPAILATGYAEIPEPAAGRVHKLSKPFGQRDLERLIAEAVPRC